MGPSPPRLRILSGQSALPPPYTWQTTLSLPQLQGVLPAGVLSASGSFLMATSILKYLIVGGNAVSAFLSWRLQATNACDVTLVWKSGYDAVSQYGISFK